MIDELLSVAEAPGHAERAHAAVRRRLHVGLGVSDHQHVGGRRAERFEHRRDDARVGLLGAAFARARDRLPFVAAEEVRDEDLRHVVGLVAEDGHRELAKREGVEELRDAGVGGGLHDEVFAVEGPEAGEVRVGLRTALLGQGAMDQLPGATADEALVAGNVVGGQAVLFEDMVHRRGDVFHAVQEGSVEIEEDRSWS